MKREKLVNFKTSFWVFMIGSFLGVIIEMIWCLLKNHYIASRRGVIYGPFNPLYGVGALVLTKILVPLKDKNNLNLFSVSFVIGSIIEYVFHYGQVYLFNTYSWSYTNNFLNINGRIDLFHSICWGFLGLFWIRIAFPLLEKLIDKITYKFDKIVIIPISIFMLFDIMLSSMAVYRWSERLSNVPSNNSISSFLDKVYPDERLEKVYPNMKIIPKS